MATAGLNVVYFAGSIPRKAGSVRYLGLLVIIMLIYLIVITIYQTPQYI